MDRQIDLANEQKYLSDLYQRGDQGQRIWAENKAKEYGFTLGQQSPQPPQTPQRPQDPYGGGFNQRQQFDEMMRWQQQMAESSFQQQKSQLDISLESQIAQLKMAYEQSIADGKVSVRDAESQFEEQLKEIEQQAYLDSERTGLYTQDMGIQNSQQAIGLMQGDNARKTGMINQNMTTRDKRVNDIRDRLTSIRSQQNIDLNRAKAEYDANLIGARASTNQQMAQNMFGLMQSDYNANRDQYYNQQNMYLGDELQRGQMQLQQGFNEKNMEIQFQNSLKSATHDSNLAIERMNLQHGLDMKKMSQALQDDFAKMAKQFGYSSALNSQEQQNRMIAMSREYEMKVKQEEDNYQRDLERNLRGVKPGTKEYELITKTSEREFKNKLTDMHNSTLYESVATDIFENTPNQKPIKPERTDWGMLGDFVTKYDKRTNDYNAQMSAYERRLRFMNDPYAYMTGSGGNPVMQFPKSYSSR